MKPSIPNTFANQLSGLYSIVVDLGHFDIPLVAKIVGGPICNSGTGRVGALYGQHHFGCSGCCPTTSYTAKIRSVGNDLSLPPWSTATMSTVVFPGGQLELQVSFLVSWICMQ